MLHCQLLVAQLNQLKGLLNKRRLDLGRLEIEEHGGPLSGGLKSTSFVKVRSQPCMNLHVHPNPWWVMLIVCMTFLTLDCVRRCMTLKILIPFPRLLPNLSVGVLRICGVQFLAPQAHLGNVLISFVAALSFARSGRSKWRSLKDYLLVLLKLPKSSY